MTEEITEGLPLFCHSSSHRVLLCHPRWKHASYNFVPKCSIIEVFSGWQNRNNLLPSSEIRIWIVSVLDRVGTFQNSWPLVYLHVYKLDVPWALTLFLPLKCPLNCLLAKNNILLFRKIKLFFTVFFSVFSQFFINSLVPQIPSIRYSKCGLKMSSPDY